MISPVSKNALLAKDKKSRKLEIKSNFDNASSVANGPVQPRRSSYAGGVQIQFSKKNAKRN